jgi:hypothetical protein
MGITFKFADIISISDLSKDGRVQVGTRKCKDPIVVLMCGVNGIENCLVVTIIFVFVFIHY